MFERIGAFVEDVGAVDTEDDLKVILAQVSRELGFAYFALTHHLNMPQMPQPGIRIHNYPLEWEHYFEEQQLGRSDPVHRACQLTAVGFAWSQLPKMIQLTENDFRVLDAAERQGIGDGFTVPAHVPGEINGSCSFATGRGVALPREHLTMAQLIGAFAFEAARRLARRRHVELRKGPHVTPRERDCLIWVARGKSDSEIATILGISPETVHQYVKHARATHDVVSRSPWVAQALVSGSLPCPDLAGR